LVFSEIRLFFKKSLELFPDSDDSKRKQDAPSGLRLALFFGIFGIGFSPAMFVIINKVLEP